MDSTSAGHATTTALPYEIYGEIVQHYYGPKDREALVSLSLVNTVWRELSQQILYREFYDEWVDHRDIKAVCARHTRFLSSIIDHPIRLGPHVRTYVQFWLVNTSEREGSDRLLAIMVEALPAMVNLQHLHVTPMSVCAMPKNMFKNCVFRLRSLTILLHVALSGLFLDFLRTQPQLRHLSIAPSDWVTTPLEANLSGLPEDVCPNLTSTSCSYVSSAHVTKSRNLVALKAMLDLDGMGRRHLSPDKLDFGQMRYLSLRIQAGRCRRKLNQMVGTDIVLLELEVPEIEVTVSNSSLWHLPNLRILVLTEYPRTDITLSFKQVLMKTFNNLPKLEFVVFDGLNGGICYRFSILRRNSNGGASELRREQIYLPRDKTRPWWTQYDGIPHTGRPY